MIKLALVFFAAFLFNVVTMVLYLKYMPPITKWRRRWKREEVEVNSPTWDVETSECFLYDV